MSNRFPASPLPLAAGRDKVHDPEKQAPRRDEKTNKRDEIKNKKDWAEELISRLLPQMDEERRKELIKKIRNVISQIPNVIFEVSFVIGVAVDPLFFYIPVINEDEKCVTLNTQLFFIAVFSRLVTDLIHMAPTIWALSMNVIRCLEAKDHQPTAGKTTEAKDKPGTENPVEAKDSGLNKKNDGEPSTEKPVEAIDAGTTTEKPVEAKNCQPTAGKTTEAKDKPEAEKPKETESDGSKEKRTERKAKGTKPATKTKFLEWINVLIKILAILPVPQVLVPLIFSGRGSNVLNTRKVLNAVVLLQYVPRVFRIYHSWEKLLNNKIIRVVVVNAAFNIFLYILASHVLGAFWYLFSVERVTACWHIACQKQVGCTPSSFRCNHTLVGNYTFLNDHCPVKTPNSTAFDFGIFSGALQSGIVISTNLPEKMVQCFWWGLRNLGSLGQNLQTSNNFWENGFAIFISICGLLLFLFLIGNIQTYIQLAIETVEKGKQKMREKDPVMQLWMDKNQIKGDMKQRIMDCVKNKMQKGYAFEENQPLLHLSEELKKEIKPLICLPLLKKVPFFEKASKDDDSTLHSICDTLLHSICDALRPRYGNENSYIIREGEPLDEMLLINRGIICTYTTDQKNKTGCLKPGDFYGEELLHWLLESQPSSHDFHPSNLRFSKMTLKCLTKVEAFSLKASDLKNIESRHPVKIAKLRQFNAKANAPEAEQKEQAEQLRRTTVSFLEEMRLSRQRRLTIPPRRGQIKKLLIDHMTRIVGVTL